jgi:hypothetical protein
LADDKNRLVWREEGDEYEGVQEEESDDDDFTVAVLGS